MDINNFMKNYLMSVGNPDTGAAFIWLKNRRPGKWREWNYMRL